MLLICFAVFFIHAILMGLDEFGFHIKRGLSPSERWARPIETLCLVGCFSFALWAPLTLPTLWLYLSLAISSIIFSLRDECAADNVPAPHEKTIHTLLFINQPILFSVTALFWWVSQSDKLPPVIAKLKIHQELILDFLLIQCVIGGLFALYQLIAWKKKDDSDMKEPTE